MSKKTLLSLMILWGVALCACAADPVRVRVNTDRVNLRAKALKTSEVVGQVNQGEELLTRSFQEEWVEVVPPATMDLWVYREFVRDERVTARDLYVRAGPGINYSVVGMLHQQDVVASRGEFGEWLKIAPPEGASLWISRELVSVIPPPKPLPPAPAIQPAPPAQTAVIRPGGAPVAPVPAPPRPVVSAGATSAPAYKPPPDMKLVPLEGQGRMVQREGELRYAGLLSSGPSKYRLVTYVNDRMEMICYVRGNTEQLRGFVGKKMLIRGREYWVEGARQAVVIPEQIIPRAVN